MAALKRSARAQRARPLPSRKAQRAQWAWCLLQISTSRGVQASWSWGVRASALALRGSTRTCHLPASAIHSLLPVANIHSHDHGHGLGFARIRDDELKLTAFLPLVITLARLAPVRAALVVRGRGAAAVVPAAPAVLAARLFLLVALVDGVGAVALGLVEYRAPGLEAFLFEVPWAACNGCQRPCIVVSSQLRGKRKPAHSSACSRMRIGRRTSSRPWPRTWSTPSA